MCFKGPIFFVSKICSSYVFEEHMITYDKIRIWQKSKQNPKPSKHCLPPVTPIFLQLFSYTHNKQNIDIYKNKQKMKIKNVNQINHRAISPLIRLIYLVRCTITFTFEHDPLLNSQGDSQHNHILNKD